MRLPKAIPPRTLLLGGALCLNALAASAGSGAGPTARLDEDANKVLIRASSPQGAPTLRSHSLGPVVLDGVCVGAVESEYYLFAFGDDGYLSQWRIGLQDGDLSPQREIPGSLGVEACAVVDGSLYLLEEETGLWRYPAHPESKPERTLLARFQPHGGLPPEAEDIRQTPEGLVVDGVRVSLPSYPDAFAPALPPVLPRLETTPVFHTGDAADDAAIWRHPDDPAQSLLLGSDKRFGLRVYNLAGQETASIPAGRINNVDLRPVRGQGRLSAVAAGSNRSRQSISLFAIDIDGRVNWLQQDEIATGLDDPYGLCMGAYKESLAVIVNDKDGRFQVWRLTFAGERIAASLEHTFELDSQPEGCVVDDTTGTLYFGIEDEGIRSISLAGAGNGVASTVADVDGRTLVADVEGLAIYRGASGAYLIASSQGNNSYAVFDLQPPHEHRGSFRITADHAAGIDGASETDGLAAANGNFGAGLEDGILVVQDGHNVAPQENQNFKVVSWRDIMKTLQIQ